MEMSKFNQNNQLAKPISQDNDNIYAANPYSSNMDTKPYEMDSMKYQNPSGISPQQIIIIDSPANERPINFLCFAQETLQNRARMNFIRKVYLLLAFQLLITIGFCCLSYFCVPFFEFQINFWWVTIIVVVLMYIMMALVICSDAFRQHPHNLIFLILFTLCFSYLMSQVTSVYAYYYGGPLVLTAAGLTLFMVLGLTLFAVFSRNDFNGLIGAAVALLFSFVGFGFLCIVTLQPILYQLYCAIAVAIMGILLVIDTKMIIGGERSISISMDDYVMGALILYIDIMRIFLLDSKTASCIQEMMFLQFIHPNGQCLTSFLLLCLSMGKFCSCVDDNKNDSHHNQSIS